MKTNVIAVHDMLSVLTVDEVEKRIGEVPGVQSATVNFAAGNVTVRYDETLLDVADIKVLIHQRGQQSAGESPPKAMSEDKPAHEHAEGKTPDAASATAAPESTVPKAAMPAAEDQETKPPPGATPSPSPAAAPDA